MSRAGRAVQLRQKRGHKEYVYAAHNLDVDHNWWTGARYGGPVCTELKRYGTVQILVFALHRVSSHVKDLVDYIATEAARNWKRDGARSRTEAKAVIKNMLVNTMMGLVTLCSALGSSSIVSASCYMAPSLTEEMRGGPTMRFTWIYGVREL